MPTEPNLERVAASKATSSEGALLRASEPCGFRSSRAVDFDPDRAHGRIIITSALTDRQRAEAVEMHESGLEIKPISATLGSSFGTVLRVLRAEGVKLRPRPGR